MSTGVIIALVVGVLVLIGLLVSVGRAAQQRRLEGRREKARGLRRQAQARSIQVESARASADEHAARSKRAQAEAEEKAAQARRDELVAQRRTAEADERAKGVRDRHDRARAVNPDISDSGEDEAIALNGDSGVARRR